jgi:hypothetical protein
MRCLRILPERYAVISWPFSSDHEKTRVGQHLVHGALHVDEFFLGHSFTWVCRYGGSCRGHCEAKGSSQGAARARYSNPVISVGKLTDPEPKKGV